MLKTFNSTFCPDHGPSKLFEDIGISVVVPLHGGGAATRRCVRALHDMSPRPSEIIVVVDGQADETTIEMARRFGMHLVRLEEQGGPARARNLGALAARQDILLFVDSDVVVPPDLISRVKEVFVTNPELHAVIGSYDDSPGDPGFFSQYRNLLHHFVHQHAKEDCSTFWGACGAVRRRAFLEINGFDESYVKPCIEDIELGGRMKRAGYKIAMIKSLQIKHLKQWTLSSILRTDLLLRAVPWTELILRSGNFTDDLNTDRCGRIKVTLAFGTMIMLGLELMTGLGVAFAIALLLLVGLMAAECHLIRFFHSKRGYSFALRCIPLILVYHLYCGLGFMLGILSHGWASFTAMIGRNSIPNRYCGSMPTQSLMSGQLDHEIG